MDTSSSKFQLIHELVSREESVSSFVETKKTDIRYVISYFGQSQFFEVLPLLGEYPKGWLFLKLTA